MPVSSIARWREYPHDKALQGMKCEQCATFYFPKKYRCSCGSDSLSSQPISGNGTVLTFTELHAPAEEFSDFVPYCLGVVELEEGCRVTAQIVDVAFAELKKGMKVRAVVRKMYAPDEKGVIVYGLKFVPALS